MAVGNVNNQVLARKPIPNHPTVCGCCTVMAKDRSCMANATHSHISKVEDLQYDKSSAIALIKT